MQKQARAGWSGVFQGMEGDERAAHRAAAGVTDPYPTHSLVVLPDGQLMYVRHASLAAAKDLLAAQRAAERRIGAAPHGDLADLAELATEPAPG